MTLAASSMLMTHPDCQKKHYKIHKIICSMSPEKLQFVDRFAAILKNEKVQAEKAEQTHVELA